MAKHLELAPHQRTRIKPAAVEQYQRQQVLVRLSDMRDGPLEPLVHSHAPGVGEGEDGPLWTRTHRRLRARDPLDPKRVLRGRIPALRRGIRLRSGRRRRRRAGPNITVGNRLDPQCGTAGLPGTVRPVTGYIDSGRDDATIVGSDRVATNTGYGLGTGVFTFDIGKALSDRPPPACRRRLVNTWNVFDTTSRSAANRNPAEAARNGPRRLQQLLGNQDRHHRPPLTNRLDVRPCFESCTSESVDRVGVPFLGRRIHHRRGPVTSGPHQPPA